MAEVLFSLVTGDGGEQPTRDFLSRVRLSGFPACCTYIALKQKNIRFGMRSKKALFCWWAVQGSNLRPLPCEPDCFALQGSLKYRYPFGISSLPHLTESQSSSIELIIVAKLWRCFELRVSKSNGRKF